MSVILGSGAHRYEVVDNWAKLPPGQEFNADVAAVGIDKQDRVYAFNRGKHPMVVLDRDGNFRRSWGEGLFPRAHGVHMAPDDTLWLTDDGDHTVRHCTLEGKVLSTIGLPGSPKPYMSGEPFHRCTHTALSPEGDLYVFDGSGQYETQWNNMHRPSGLCRERGSRPRFYVGEIGGGMAVNYDMPNIGPRVSIYSDKGEMLARLGHRPAGLERGQFVSPHGLAVDSRGDIYVGEVSFTNWQNRHRDQPPPAGLRSLRKLVKLR